MTRLTKKKLERFFVEEAARRLNATWLLSEDREHPDFIVIEDGREFGLEVTELFVGSQTESGSHLKMQESLTQRAVTSLRREYESVENVPLIVKFVGDMGPENLATVVPALAAADLPSKPVGHHFVHDTTVEYPSRARLRVHVTKGFRADWFSVNDRAGFVDRNPSKIIAEAINKKGEDLARYKNAVGDDVRLLLVANRINNSGKLTLDEKVQFDFRGFREIYLFSYPEYVVVLERLR